jgi:hypothetical protein
VRIPSLKEVRCPDGPDKPCSLIGQNPFLIDSVASDPQFAQNIVVPAAFVNSALSVPRPNGTTVPPFENANIYSLIAEILGLDTTPTDGDLKVLTPILGKSLEK